MFDEEVEKGILYYLIYEKENLDVNENDFTQIINIEIIKAINELKREKKEISLIAVNNKLKKNSIEYLSELGNHIYNSSADELYMKLKELTKKRELYKLSKDIVLEVAKQENVDAYIEQLILDLKKIEYKTEKEETFTDQLMKTVQEIENNLKKQKDLSYHTGIFELDELTDGLHPSELTVVGARPRSW